MDDLADRLVVWMLGAEWTPDELLVRCRRALGREPDWLADLLRAVLDRHPTKPSGSPRGLAELIRSLDVFTEGVERDERAGAALRVESLPVGDIDPPEQRMGTPPWPVPVIGTETALADLLRVDPEVLLWLADPQRRRRRSSPSDPLQPYRFRWLDRGDRTPRLLEIPGPLLRQVQRQLLRRVLAAIGPHPAAHGFVPGRGPVRHARHHAGADWLITCDLTTFFASVGALRVSGIFTTAGFPEGVGRLLTGLCTVSTPAAVLQGMPPGGPMDARAELGRSLRTPHLPQGAPTSPALSNLIGFNLDRRLTGLADRWGARYTRYADDLAFSGAGRRPGPDFVALVRRIVVDEGFQPNDDKLRVRGRGSSHRVTGIVVNAHPNLPRVDHDRLRAILHDAVRHGPDRANRDGHPDFRAHLAGRIAWVEQLNPTRGARLRRQFDRIVWPEQ